MGSRKNNFQFCAPRCAADLAWAIEGNRRRSLAYVENFQIEPEPKMWCRWDVKSGSYSCANPKPDFYLSLGDAIYGDFDGQKVFDVRLRFALK